MADRVANDANESLSRACGRWSVLVFWLFRRAAVGHLIDMGAGGGPDGEHILAAGTP
jgi:hypothetical protein